MQTVGTELLDDVKVKFQVELEDFQGTFEVLLSLIAKHKMDVTQLALSVITDEFVAYVKTLLDDTDKLEEISSFILIASTLLDIKASRLLPNDGDFDDDDLELLESQDLLFAKLLQYKAYKDVALAFSEHISSTSLRHQRIVSLEERFAKLLPELIFNTDTKQLVLLASSVISAYNYRSYGVHLEHIHIRQVSVAKEGIVISKILLKKSSCSFSELITGKVQSATVIGRFLSLLELYKMNAITFDQRKPLGELVIKWVANKDFNYIEKLQGSDFDISVQPVQKRDSHSKGVVKSIGKENNAMQNAR